MFKKIDYKKELGLYLAIFVLIYLLYNNSYFVINPTNLIKPIINFQLGGLLNELLKDIFLIIPYLVFAAVLFYVIKHFANLIKDKNIRRILKAVSLFILVFGSLSFAFYVIQPQYKKADQQSPPNTSTSTLTSTNTTTTTNTTSSSTTPNNSTYPSHSITFTPPSIVSLQIPDYFYQILNILSLFVILFVLFIFIRSFRPYLFRNTKWENDQKTQKNLKNIENLDLNRQTIIQEYLKLSKELEIKGINPDFSLTPVEFGNEAIFNLNIEQFKEITFYYELARFSNSPISTKELQEFKSLIDEIYANLSNILKEEEKQ